MKKLTTLFAILFLSFLSFGQVGSIENIDVEQRTDGSGIVDIYFDLLHSGTANYNISLEASFDGGSTFSPVAPEYLSGDLVEVAPGTGFQIIWDGLASHPDIFTEEAMVKIIANKVEATVTDVEGNVYPYVVIGTQTWMAKNLQTTKYNNGDDITTGLANEAWQNTTSGAYSVFPHTGDSWGNPIEGIDSDGEMINAYGILYNWYAVVDERGVCPTGWRIPTLEDYETLRDFAIGEGYPNEWNSVEGVADALRSTSVAPDPHPRWDAYEWEDYNHLDVYGFNALPSGYRTGNGDYYSLGQHVYWWTTSLFSEDNAWTFRVEYSSGDFSGNPTQQTMGYSVRCIKDE